MKPEQWLAELERALAQVGPHDKELIVSDAKDALAESTGISPESMFGSPQEYARLAGTELRPPAEPGDPQGTIGPAQIEFRGPVSAVVRSRIWDPSNPGIITSHMFGIGWGINFGAVAVKLRLLRPDDYDTDTVRAIPPTVRATSEAIPIALTATTIMAATVRGGGSRTFRHRLANIAYAAAPTFWSRKAAPGTEDRLIRNALASWIATIAVIESFASPEERPSRKASIFGVVLSFAVLMGQFVVPVRAGLRAMWKQEDGSDE